jgi:hypothetical protein
MNKFTLWIATSALLPVLVNAEVRIDFYPDSKIRPENNPYPVTITDLGNTPPSVSTTDPSSEVPGLAGSVHAGDADDGFIVLTLDGRGNRTTRWDPDRWSGGASHPVKGSDQGLGIEEAEDDLKKIDDGEAILWSFDLSSLNLNSAAYLADGGADFEADDNPDRRDLFAPFEGSRRPGGELNDVPLTHAD